VLQSADVILHAGDVLAVELLHELGGFAPVYAVLGNNDDAELAALLPMTRVEVLGDVRVGMIHDSGATAGREGRMRRRFPDCGVVVYGHSHVPFAGTGIDGQLLFNPGSPTERRAQPKHTVGVLDLEGGLVRNHEIVVLD
jgi:putative phosphoesterase